MAENNTRLWDKLGDRFTPEPNSGCFLWLGPYDKDGYGKIHTEDGRYLRAHRYTCELVGKPIPDGYLGCHKCDNPTCVNPQHIFHGTHKSNHEDRGRKGRQAKGSKIGASKLTAEQVLEIRSTKPGEHVAFSKYGIKRTHYYRLMRGEGWEHLNEQ